jgi:phytoene/squalene synthetase
VRFADEIVDTFHQYNKRDLLNRFKADTYEAVREGISLNPILHSFQRTVNTYRIEHELIETFLKSMEMDLDKKDHTSDSFQEYILGSAEVVGLMCLRVFCNGNHAEYEKLKPYAMSLGSAFQKINFLRDLRADYNGMGRSYFPGIDLDRFTDESKRKIEENIARDFAHAFHGIKQLPAGSRFGVYVAYVYYLALFKKIRGLASAQVMESRVRIRNRHKAKLLAVSYLKHQFNRI